MIEFEREKKIEIEKLATYIETFLLLSLSPSLFFKIKTQKRAVYLGPDASFEISFNHAMCVWVGGSHTHTTK
jgi:hypothetical protein